MKNKQTVLLILLLLAALIAAAGIAYNSLSGQVESNQLIALDGGNVVSTAAPTDAPTATGAPTEAPVATEAPAVTEAPATASPVPTATPKTNANGVPLIMSPNFTVEDAQGNPVSLHDYIGKPVVLNFWASWCGPCRMEMPAFQQMLDKYGSEVHFLFINLTDGYQETKETAQAHIAEAGYSFPLLFDTTGSAANTYGVASIPQTYFLDAEGYVIAQGAGALNVTVLEKGIGMILP